MNALLLLSAAKYIAPLGAGGLALLVLIQSPPFGNIWFDLLAGALALFLCQCFAFALERPHEGSSDSYKSFYRFCSAVFGLGAILARHGELWEKFAGRDDKNQGD